MNLVPPANVRKGVADCGGVSCIVSGEALRYGVDDADNDDNSGGRDGGNMCPTVGANGSK